MLTAAWQLPNQEPLPMLKFACVEVLAFVQGGMGRVRAAANNRVSLELGPSIQELWGTP